MSDKQNDILAAVNAAQPLRFELVEVYVDANNAGQSQFTFPTNNNLQMKRVLYVDAYNVETFSVTVTQHNVIPVSVFIRSTLTLYTTKQQKELIQRVPFSALNPYDVPGGTAPFAQQRILLNNAQTDWNKCYIQTGGAIGGGGNVSFLLGVWYVDL